MTLSNSTDNVKKRYDNNINQTLYPILENFIMQIKSSSRIQDIAIIDRPYLGKETEYGNTGLIFDEYLDAIDITMNIEFYKKQQLCQLATLSTN